MVRKRTRKEWIERGERAARLREPKGRDLSRAKRVFAQELSPKKRFELVEEIVETRGNELCRAYRGVCQISAGYRIKTTGRKRRRRRVQRTAAVVFVVLRKWRRKRDERESERVPSHVFAYVSVGRQRALCAVPTDVVDVADHSKITPDASIELVPKTGDDVAWGSIACAIRRTSRPDRTFLLSARHVLSVSKYLHGTSLAGSIVRSFDDGRPVAETRAISGRLVDTPGTSLDAQVARVTHPRTLWRLLDGRQPRTLVARPSEIPTHTCYVVTAGKAVPVKFASHEVLGPAINYGPNGPHSVANAELLSWQFTGSVTTQEGDSGSPVMTEKDGGALLGMHIAADRSTGFAYAIPAWRLLPPDGYPGAGTTPWELLSRSEVNALKGVDDPLVTSLLADRRFNGGVRWHLDEDGIRIQGRRPEVTSGRPTTVGRVWTNFGDSIEHWASHFEVPVELIIATICTESSGRPAALRKEPGYVSDSDTPKKISVGLMQTLISTARSVMPASQRSRVTRHWLTNPHNSIRVGTAYIAEQQPKTGFDPPKVACAYNAGAVRRNNSPNNRWRMKQYRIDTSEHADKFVRFFNDVFRYFDAEGTTPSPSFREHF